MAKEISSELMNTILTRVGGPGNIASCGNCMTRLRLGVQRREDGGEFGEKLLHAGGLFGF